MSTTDDRAEDTIWNPRNRDGDFLSYFDEKQKQFLKTLVNDEVIEEHRSRPLGQHTEPLARLLHYFRRLPIERQYAVRKDSRLGTYTIVRLSGVRGQAPDAAADVQLQTIEEAYHKIFMLQIGELMRG